ncbi:hypothetical protein [Pedobacter alluvionis]|uniref:Uncharacterized protein n=1 Tax=Pedobacter alluvionis TaxID=475253 RepID=A0A497YAD6_9SPHI|nr:hypothetical protein [Pedobacter alluvionis]RLJ80523.1 hypothetical protein BCL90_1305 [Pedobacter alluvionis]TFB31793.1 hypothetical protein E3V97_14530 [Pedobacter alluvionis]
MAAYSVDGDAIQVNPSVPQNANITITGYLTAGQSITAEGIEITDATRGIVLKSPNGNRWRITVSDSGVLTTAAL